MFWAWRKILYGKSLAGWRPKKISDPEIAVQIEFAHVTRITGLRAGGNVHMFWVTYTQYLISIILKTCLNTCKYTLGRANCKKLETSCLRYLPIASPSKLRNKRPPKTETIIIKPAAGQAFLTWSLAECWWKYDYKFRKIGILNSKLPTYITKPLSNYLLLSACLWLFKKTPTWANAVKNRKETMHTHQGTDQCCRGIHQVQNRSEHEGCNAWSKSIWANQNVFACFCCRG